MEEGCKTMKIDSIKTEGDKLSFNLSGVGTSFANAMRRLLISSIPVYAADKVVFYENSSAFFDEYISNRIALIPLTTPANDEPGGEGVMLTLDAEGPKTVYSRDFGSTDARIVPACKNIPITKLSAGQRLRVEAKARMGTSREHAKFQSCVATYEEKDGVFKFKVESFGNLSPRELLLKASTLFEEKAQEALKQVKEK